MELKALSRLSLDQKLITLVIGFMVFGVANIALYLGTTRFVVKAQEDHQKATDARRALSVLESQYNRKAIAMSTFIANPTDAVWSEKESIDKTLDAQIERLKVMHLDEAAAKIVDQLAKFQKNYLNPLDLTLRQALKTSTTEFVLRIYAEEYSPLLQKLGGLFASGSKILAEAVEAKYEQVKAFSRLGTIMTLFGNVCGLFLWIFVTRSISRSISVPLRKAIAHLEEQSRATDQFSDAIQGASRRLTDSTSKLAAALQETASSVEEMSAMINKNAESASESGKAASTSEQVAARGKISSQHMLEAISEINRANEQIMTQVEESNRRMTDITRVISEIGNKTAVINDIVFQTKLLSFNASVEAARAGEHGKGFSVVAEEVGNLAAMSGSAAREINYMLSESIQRVETIVGDTKSSVERLVLEGKQKVDVGARVSQESGKVLDQIVSEVNKVNAMLSEIVTATQEQAAGVQEIARAMNDLDRVTQQNSEVSQQISASAESLIAQSRSMRGVVLDLQRLITGRQAVAMLQSNVEERSEA